MRLSDGDLRKRMRRAAKVGLDEGFLFGIGGEGFQRIILPAREPSMKKPQPHRESSERVIGS